MNPSTRTPAVLDAFSGRIQPRARAVRNCAEFSQDPGGSSGPKCLTSAPNQSSIVKDRRVGRKVMVRQGALGLAAVVSALTCACTSASTGSPPAIIDKPPLTGDATGFTYQLSDYEKAYSCKKLTGIVQVRILQMRGRKGRAKSSLASRGIHAVSQSVIGGTAESMDHEEQYTRDHAMLDAYNRQLAAKNCKTFDITAELKARASARGVPTPKDAENTARYNKPKS